MAITGVETAISVAGIVSECLLLVTWLVRGRQSPFWLVGFYGIYHLLFSVSVRVLHLRTHNLSDWIYYTDYAIDFAFLSGVISELFMYTVRPIAAWPRRTRMYLILGLAIGTSIPVLLVTSLRFAGFTRTVLWDDRLDLLTSLLQCTFLVVSALTGAQLRVRRNADVGAIRLGLVIWAGLSLIVNLCRMNWDWKVSPIFDEVVNASWVFMVSFWALAVWRSDRTNDKAIAAPS